MHQHVDPARPSPGGAALFSPAWALEIVSRPWFERLALAVIVLNAITLGMETSPTIMRAAGDVLHKLDTAMMTFFVVELALRMYANGLRFWRDPWNVFDFLVVAITIAPTSGDFSVLRAMRILRALRLITAIPSVKRVVTGLLSAIPSMSSIIMLVLLINYIFAVMATKMYGADFPTEFGTIGASLFTFFQVMTLEGWAGNIVRPVMEKHPYAWAFFLPYIVFVTFAVLNLFIGIVVDAMQHQADDVKENVNAFTLVEYQHLVAEITALRAELRASRQDDPVEKPDTPSGRRH